MCDSFLCQVAWLHFFLSSCSWHQDYHKRETSVKPALICTQVLQINLEVAIKKHEPLLFFYWNLLPKKGEKEREKERPFNFIASRTLKYSLRSTFCFQPLCRRQDSWHLCMLLPFTMLFSLQMCTASDPSIPSNRSYWPVPSYEPCPGRHHSTECKTDSSCVQCFVRTQGWSFVKKNTSQLTGLQQADASVCLHFICVFMWLCSCCWVWVHNAWSCWEEWLLYSCLVGAVGARAMSLGSCMDGLRRSPSFIKHTPTCKIDLAKKQGGNSSSSVFPNHKSLWGVHPPTTTPPPPGERWHHCQCAGPLGQQKGQFRNSRSYTVAPKCPLQCDSVCVNVL